MTQSRVPGRLARAPENFLDPQQISAVQAGRRGFLHGAFLAAAALASGKAAAQGAGDPEILELPAHSRGLGQPVAARPDRAPSPYEQNLQRPGSPCLTRAGAASVS